MIFSDIVSEVSPQHNITQNMFDVFVSFILHSWFLILVSSDWTSSWRLDSQFIPNYDVFETLVNLVNVPYWLSLSLIGSWWLNQLIHNFWCVLFWWSLRAAISDGFDMFWLLHLMFRWFLRILTSHFRPPFMTQSIQSCSFDDFWWLTFLSFLELLMIFALVLPPISENQQFFRNLLRKLVLPLVNPPILAANHLRNLRRSLHLFRGSLWLRGEVSKLWHPGHVPMVAMSPCSRWMFEVDTP